LVITFQGQEDLDIFKPSEEKVSYLTVPVFRILASIYLGISIDEHPLLGEIVRLMQTVDVTTAEVVSNVIHRYDAETALQGEPWYTGKRCVV